MVFSGALNPCLRDGTEERALEIDKGQGGGGRRLTDGKECQFIRAVAPLGVYLRQKGNAESHCRQKEKMQRKSTLREATPLALIDRSKRDR